MHQDDEAMAVEIATMLEIDHQYVRSVEAWNDDLVAQIRRCGRAAGRRLGYRVRTFATSRDERDDRRRTVCVVVMASNTEDEERIRERSMLLLEQAFRGYPG
jgi:hypothetical protein